MKNLLTKFNIQLFLTLLGVGFFSNSSNAHFGSKGPFGGSVSCGIASATTVYLGTTEGGVYESTTSGIVAWRARPVGLKSGKISALAHTGSYLFAGTADSGVFIFNGYSGTSDRYWIKVNNGLPNLKIKALVAIDTITVLVGTDGGGVYKTTNKGASWVSVNNVSLTSAVVTAFIKTGNRVVLASQSGGLFVSDDNGTTWTDFNDNNTLTINGTNALSYNSSTDEILVLNNNGLFKAGTAGTTNSPVFSAAQTGLPSCQIRSISNNGTDWYLATDQGVYTSGSGAINWVSANTGLIGDALNINVVVPFQTNLIAGSFKEGVFKTAVSTINWVATNTNFNNLVTYSVASQDSLLVIAATERGIFVSKDLAANYSRANTGLTDSLNVTDITISSTNLFASTKNKGIFVSADSGRTWTTYNLGLGNLNIKKLVASESYLYAICSNNMVYQSTGLGWTTIQNGLPVGVVPTSFAFYSGTILLGTSGNGVFTRLESSGSWNAVNTGLSNLQVTSVTSNGTKLFAGTNGSGVFVSDISSISWTSAAPLHIAHTSLIGLDGSRVQAMAYYRGYVYASYQGGLLASSDNGATWIAAGNQFNLPSYTNVSKISFVTSRVFVTTENNSLYSQGFNELPILVETSVKGELLEKINAALVISPNPNQGNFKISMENSSLDFSELIIFNSYGLIVDRFDHFQNEISVIYPKGIYYVKVSSPKGSTIKKMIVE